MTRVLWALLAIAGLIGTAAVFAGIDMGDGSILFPLAALFGIGGLVNVRCSR